jgi:multiphosphoryl transfer protein
MLGRSGRMEIGQPAVEGLAIGVAVRWAGDPAPRARVGSAGEEHIRLARALARATRGVVDLTRLLPPAEAELFEPEIAILGELGPAMLARVDAGERPEDVVSSATSLLATDVLDDARARLLDGLAHDERSVETALEGREGDLLLVTEALTPSVVASLPAHVVGIVAAADNVEPGTESGSHAAILARARDIPLAFVPPAVVRSIHDDDPLVIDTTTSPASLWVIPPASVVSAARARRDQWTHTRSEEEAAVAAPLVHLGVKVHVNIGSLRERVPASADGVGLVRTELLFSGHTTAPSESEQFGSLRALAARAAGRPVTVRLFDAGGDKPLPWLRVPDGVEARGIELLGMHPTILEAQLRATVRASEHADVRVLLPIVTRASQVEQLRARCRRALPVGAMVETQQAVERIDEIAAASDFVSIGTNDLSAEVTGQRRASSALSLDRRVLRMVERVVLTAHARGLVVSVCGEMAGDPHGARLLVGLGVDALSVATGRLAKAKLSLRDVTLDDCRRVVRETLR